MKTTTVIVLGFLVVFGIIFAGFGCTALSYRSDCVRMEAKVVAQYDQNRNNYDNMWKKFREMAQVPDKYAGDMKKMWADTMRARYGEGGSKALFQFIQEHNPQLDPSMYVKLESAIEAGRNSFAADQQQLIDVRRQYEVVLKDNRALFVGWIFSYPTIDLKKYDIVTSDKTDDAFRTKKSDEVDIFGQPDKDKK